MTLPKTPIAWAIRLSQILQHLQSATGEKIYPIRVQDIACDISKQFFPEAPITQISGETFSTKFEGMLRPVPKTTGQWGIIYNNAIKSRGRINFTLAHEFGHYLVHRGVLAEGIQCTRQDMMGWDTEYGQREAEANQFASYLLMPRNMLEAEMNGETLNLHLMQHVADHFDVSITATVLKWLEFTNKRAMLIVARDGFVDWARSSQKLFESGVFLRPKQETIGLPAQSLASRQDKFFDNESGTHHKAGVWPFKEDVQEFTLLADSYDMTITLLVFNDQAPFRYGDDAPEEKDSFDRFMKFEKERT